MPVPSPKGSRNFKTFLNGDFPGIVYMKLRFARKLTERNMNWVAPIVTEICVGMEVTSYDSADIDVSF